MKRLCVGFQLLVTRLWLLAAVLRQAVAAYRVGCKGLVLPKANVEQLSLLEWPADGGGEPLPSEEVRRQWPEARRQLLFKPVGSVAELAAFFFPGLAAAAAPQAPPAQRGGGRGGGRRRHQKARRVKAAAADGEEVKKEVGDVSVMRVPVWEQPPSMATVEACLVKGAEKPVSRQPGGRSLLWLGPLGRERGRAVAS